MKVFKTYFFPDRISLYPWVRLSVALILNAILGIYAATCAEHMWDVRDYRYVAIPAIWLWMMVVLPSLALLDLVPVIIVGHTIMRWLSISLSVLPAYLAGVGWLQLIIVLFEVRNAA